MTRLQGRGDCSLEQSKDPRFSKEVLMDEIVVIAHLHLADLGI